MATHRSARSASLRFALTLASSLVVCAHYSQAQNVWHVNRAAAAGGDGLSWASAFDSLDLAVAAAAQSVGTDDVRIARGVYTPSTPTDPNRPRSATFSLAAGTRLQGGWNAVTNQPPPAGYWNGTTLSGDLGAAGRALHVVTAGPFADPLAPEVRLSNLVIRGGAANDAAAGDVNGGGLIQLGGSLRIDSVHFANNSALGNGGGLFFDGFPLHMKYSRFSANAAQGAGGGLYTRAEVRCYNSMFVNNSAGVGGGAAVDNSILPVPSVQQRIVGCRFRDNRAVDLGGALAFTGFPGLDTGRYRVINCTLAGNVAGVQSGGIHAAPSSEGRVLNCVLWGNDAPLDPELPPGLLVDTSIVAMPGATTYPGWLGPTNFNSDPLLATNLLIGSMFSPCIDVGRNAHLPFDYPDTDGNGVTIEPLALDCLRAPRVSNSLVVDIGAHELQP
jgi:hypothetical protein